MSRRKTTRRAINILEWGEAILGWQLGVALNENITSCEKTIDVTILLKNVGNDLQIVHGTSIWENILELEDEKGPVSRTAFGMNTRFAAAEGRYIPSELMPDEIHTSVISLSRVFILTKRATYRLRVSRPLYVEGSQEEVVYAKSNEVSFKIKR